ncbi:MAG TPA: methyltransferase domain-containing protein [Thermomicrobiales bacterium]|nr:methyltransferase domain-containing protein [Thermomicrobiales bacterium]
MTTTEPKKPAEWDAETYHRVANPHVVWGQPVLARLPLVGNETVIDAGCGTGRMTAELLDRLPEGHVIALDRSATMLDEARRFLSPRFGERVSFLQADLAADRFDVEADHVFSTATFHWVGDHQRLFTALYTALRPGGWLVAQCGGGPNIARLRERIADLAAGSPFARPLRRWPGPWTFATPEETGTRLANAGFIDIETGVIPAPTTLDDASAYREFLRTVVLGEHLARLSTPADQDALLDHLTAQAANDDPPFTLDYWRLNLRGRRPAISAS